MLVSINMSIKLYYIQCVQLGIGIRDFDLLTIGMLNDMLAESRNDEYKGYHEVATKADMDVFNVI